MNHQKPKKIFDRFFEVFDRYPREYFIFAFFLLFMFAILKETFAYTVLKYDFYDDLAYKQQVGEVEIPVTRGTIYSSTGSGTVLSTSVDLNDLAIDPQIEGDKQALWEFLVDIVYKELCTLKSYQECYENTLKYLKKLKIDGFSTDETYIKKLLTQDIQQKISQSKVTSVLVSESIASEDATEIFNLSIPWVYVNNNNLYVNPEEVADQSQTAKVLASILWENTADIEYTIRKRDLRYVPIINKLSLGLTDDIHFKIFEEKQALKQGVITPEESIGGFIILTPRPQRIYPEWKVASQIIGFLDNSGTWHYGLEWEFNDLLQGMKWEMVSRKDIKGRIIDPISINRDTLTWQWVDIYTTIDRNIQRKVEKLLEAGVKKYRANKGTVVVMNPKTGAILAMANYPTYDPNNPWDVYELEKVNYLDTPNPETDLLGKTVFVEDREQWEKYIYDGKEIYLREAQRSEYGDYEIDKYKYKNNFWAGVYQNDAISWLYEPWSIMKAITVAIGIDTGEISRGEMYNDAWKVEIDSFTIRNDSQACLGYHSFDHALSFSCNVGMIRIAQRVGQSLFHQYFENFGFSEVTDISLEWEVYSKLMPYEKWSMAKLFTSSYGLWVSVTPLQMATAYSVLANGGVYVKPRIIESIQFSDGKQIVYKPDILRRVIKESTARDVSEMMVNGVEKWVADNGLVPWYTVAGKTGTSQIAYKGQYEKWAASTYGSFAWFWPAEDPEFVVVVKLDRPRTSNYGWQTSAFIFSEIASELFEYYGIPKKS